MSEVTIFDSLIGTVLTRAYVSDTDENEALLLEREIGGTVRFMHHQSCCESVYIEDIEGDLEDLVGSPILQAEEVTEDNEEAECGMWTFYKFATAKGRVTIRFYGSSNGYYSVGVSVGII